MKVYVRRWNGKVFERQKEELQLNSYNGLCFCCEQPCVSAVATHIPNVKRLKIYLHASEPNVLVVYVEDVE